MPSKRQIQLIQIAVRAAGLRTGKDDGRYRLLLGQYRKTNGAAVTSCKELSNHQIDDLLAICESLGWEYKGKVKSHYRNRIALKGDLASFAQQEAIKHLAGDLGWNDAQLSGMIKRMTRDKKDSRERLNGREAYMLIEALKNMFGRQTGKRYGNLKEVKRDMEVTDGEEGKQEQKSQVG